MTFRLLTLALATAVVTAPHASYAQNSTSAERTRTLVPLLEKAGLTARRDAADEAESPRSGVLSVDIE